jgi:hypothetical protein
MNLEVLEDIVEEAEAHIPALEAHQDIQGIQVGLEEAPTQASKVGYRKAMVPEGAYNQDHQDNQDLEHHTEVHRMAELLHNLVEMARRGRMALLLGRQVQKGMKACWKEVDQEADYVIL